MTAPTPARGIVARFASSRLRRLATGALVGGLGARGTRRLAEGLRASERDRVAYGRLATLFGALEGGAPLTAAQHDRILDGIRARVAREAGQRRPARGLLPVLAPALSMVLLLVLAIAVSPRPGDDAGLTARGQAAPPGTGRVGLKALCIRAGQVVPPPPRTAEESVDARCRLDDELQLVVTHAGGPLSQLLVVGLMGGAEARELYYFPVPPTGRSAGAPGSVVDEVLGRAVRLEVNHRPGKLRVVALFSATPLEAGQVHAWLRALPEDEPAAPTLTRLAGGASEVVELRIEIEGSAKPTPKRGAP